MEEELHITGVSPQAEEFRTSDMSLAAVLKMSGLSYSCDHLIPGEPDGRGVWVFKDADKVNKIITSYESGKVKVEPRAFQAAVRAVRNDMYEFVDSPGVG